MSRLFDRVKASYPSSFKELPQIVVASNVSDYFFEGTDKERWDLSEDFPNCVPPFKNLWVEFRAPKEIVSRELGRTSWLSAEGRPTSWGWHIQTRDTQDSAIDNDVLFGRDEWVSNPIWRNILKEARWVFTSRLFWEEGKGNVTPVENLMVMATSQEGKIMTLDGKNHIIISLPEHKAAVMSGEEKQELIDTLATFMQPALLTLSFMNCKNVKLVEPADKKREKHPGKKPFYRYYVLEIEPMKQRLKYVQKEKSVDLIHALHICRGHFKDYRESGLFGQHKGVYWWDSMVRGSAEEGLVDKDYELKK